MSNPARLQRRGTPTTRHYAYGFDFDVIHPLMVRSFAPFFRPGSMLELGSFKGDFTPACRHFSDITCVEASDQAMQEAKQRLGDKFQGFNALLSRYICLAATTTSS